MIKRFNFVSAVIGFILGALVTGFFAHNTISVMEQRSDVTRDAVRATEQELSTLLATERQRASACEAKFQQRTVLYEFDQAQGIPLLNGAITLAPGSQSHPVGQMQPRWIIPAQITPMLRSSDPAAADSRFAFAYIDAHGQLSELYRPALAGY